MSQSRFIMVTDKAVYNYQKKSKLFLFLKSRNIYNGTKQKIKNKNFKL